jgi:hypothetical protein
VTTTELTAVRGHELAHRVLWDTGAFADAVSREKLVVR